MFFISCFRKKKVNKEVRRMQCDCTLDPGQIMAVTQTSLYAEYGYVHFTVRELSNPLLRSS